MRCGAIIDCEKKRKGVPKLYYETGIYDFPEKYYICNGKIQVYLQARGEPVMGGIEPVLSIEYKCDTCGRTDFPELPGDESDFNSENENSISDLVTYVLDELSEVDRTKLYEKYAPIQLASAVTGKSFDELYKERPSLLKNRY